MSGAWTQVGLKNVSAALAILDQFAVDKMRAFETQLLLDDSLDPDDIDVAVAIQQHALETWIAHVGHEVRNGLAHVSRGPHA